MVIIFLAKTEREGIAVQEEAKLKSDNEIVQQPEISFSVNSGFYDEDIILIPAAAKDGEIHYTADGSRPDKYNKESTFRYEKPIPMTADNEEKVYVYSFKVYYEDGTESEVYSNTYFLGKNIEHRYDTPVISLMADNNDLYGHENGIFIEGKLREEWKQAHPGEEPVFDTPANYNIRGRESERDVYIEIFEPNGEKIISQDGGIRISGNFTRQSEQKSFKLYARAEYDELNNKFRFPLFHDMRSAGGGELFDKFHSLKIRNTGNDRSEGFIRDELGLTLAAEAGIADTQAVRPVSVYINGVYQGLYWMHTTYDNDYFEEKYGDFEGEMVVIGNSEMNMKTDTEDPLSNEYANEYNELYARFSTLDLTDQSVYEELNDVIDINNYLRYFAAEVYMANKDWPFNNIEAYRYVSPTGEYRDDSVFDGKYRYLLYDVDTTMGLGSVRDSLNPNQSLETLTMLEERNYAPLFTGLMKREDCRKYFASYICDLMNGAYSPENVAAVLDKMHEQRWNEMQEYIEESLSNPAIPEIGEAYLGMQMDCINAWAEATPDSMANGIAQMWNLGEVYSLHTSLFEGDGIKINSLEIKDPEFTGRYLSGCDTTIAPILPEGRVFQNWEINGETYMEEEVVIDAGMLIDGALYITLYTGERGGGLVLSEIKAKGKEDYIVLTNTSEDEVNTWGYYLMDKEKASHMNYLEELKIAPGDSVLIGCKNYQGTDSFMNVNFNLKKGNKLSLAYSSRGVKEQVEIPDLASEDGVYKKDLVTGRWQEERNR